MWRECKILSRLCFERQIEPIWHVHSSGVMTLQQILVGCFLTYDMRLGRASFAGLEQASQARLTWPKLHNNPNIQSLPTFTALIQPLKWWLCLHTQACWCFGNRNTCVLWGKWAAESLVHNRRHNSPPLFFSLFYWDDLTKKVSLWLVGESRDSSKVQLPLLKRCRAEHELVCGVCFKASWRVSFTGLCHQIVKEWTNTYK